MRVAKNLSEPVEEQDLSIGAMMKTYESIMVHHGVQPETLIVSPDVYDIIIKDLPTLVNSGPDNLTHLYGMDVKVLCA